ncbi:MAG: alpha/beta hydrolase [Lentisphaerae bacterium]|nr:alpha/beta hydrolase [Lentisphaerota bacterium]
MKIQLGETLQDQTCTIEYFLHPEGGERGMVIVFPGGGYQMLAPHEAVPVAEKFVELGFHAAVCMYRIKPVTYPVPLEDARNAVKYTREHAAELGVKPDKIAVLGFSAGGHLAAMVSNMPGSEAARPNASILCYAVLSALTENPHLGSYYNLFGNELPAEDYREFSWPAVADCNTPPAFIWHTAPDTTVPVENSIEYFMALKKLNIHSELHIYPQGNHGLSLGDRPGMENQFDWIKSWPALCARFLQDLGW